MRIFNKSRTRTSCSFCGKTHEEVAKLVAGPGVFICDTCITVCADILARGMGASKLIKLGEGFYNVDHLVALKEVDAPPPVNAGWDTPPPMKELLLEFSGGLTVHVPLTERERIEKLMLRGNRTI